MVQKIRHDIRLLPRLYHAVSSADFLMHIGRVYGFCDDPSWYQYGASLKCDFEEITTTGFSFSSGEVALLKCLGESIERHCLYSCRKNSLFFADWDHERTTPFNTTRYSQVSSMKHIPIGWVKGHELVSGKDAYLPAQLVFLNYTPVPGEIPLASQVTTGAAGGFDRQSAILRGIYEVVERDAYMSSWLLSIRLPRLDVSHIDDHAIQDVLNQCRRYKLELYLFDMTNDLGIPSYCCILIDRTGVGPAVSAGIKSNLDNNAAVIGCMEEAFFIRSWIADRMHRQEYDATRHQKTIQTPIERGLYWSSPKMIEHIDYLLDQPLASINTETVLPDGENSLEVAINLLRRCYFRIYFVDISQKSFRNIPYVVYKVIIPGLQPMYFDEKNPEIISDRLQTVASFFKQKVSSRNPYPYPL